SGVVHQAGAAAPSAGRLRLSGIRRAGRVDIVWTRALRLVPALSFLCRSHLEGSQAGRSSRSAANEVRTGHQPQDRQGAWPPNSRQTGCHRRRGDRVNRRGFITLLGGAAAWPLAARAQQAATPVIGFVNAASAKGGYARPVSAFRQGLSGTGYVEGRNVAIEWRWAAGQNDRLTAMIADLVHSNEKGSAETGTSSWLPA